MTKEQKKAINKHLTNKIKDIMGDKTQENFCLELKDAVNMIEGAIVLYYGSHVEFILENGDYLSISCISSSATLYKETGEIISSTIPDREKGLFNIGKNL